MAQVIIALTDATSAGAWYAPADCNGTITVELIGPGTGGGGAYVKSTLTGVIPGAKYYINFLNDTWINTVNSMPAAGSSNATGAKAAGGTYSTGIGGLVSNSAYNVLAYSGGSGGATFNGLSTSGSTGAGGAAGPSGPGGNGEAGANGAYGGRGGSSNGRPAGYNGGAANTYDGDYGKADYIWTDFAGNLYGPAGGSSLGTYTSYSKGGNTYRSGFSYAMNAGGGGLNISGARNGLIVITYTPAQIPGTYTEVIRTTGTTPWRVPLGVTFVKVEAIGAGGPGLAKNGGYGDAIGGGGGGAYAATNSIPVLPETISYVFLGPSETNAENYTVKPSWFNCAGNSPPTSTDTGVKAAGGNSGGKVAVYGTTSVFGGLASNSIGDVKFDGGPGELSARPDVFYTRGPGGGGAAGPGGAGKRGGKENLVINAVGGGGGGGGAGGSSSTAGGNAVTSTGGTGGSGPSGTAGGLGGSTSRLAAAGTDGAGGGGGGGTATSTYRNGGAGGTYPVWTNTAGDTFGPGGGGGGAGGTAATANTAAGAGGTYGGGGGAGASFGGVGIGGAGGQGLIVLTYTVVAASALNDRYWVGGSGIWDGTNTANWSTASGGTPGATVPTSVNNVFFDANSNTGTSAFTVTIATTTALCTNFDATGVDGVMTLAGTVKLQVYGNFTLPLTSFINSFTGTLFFAARALGKTINFNGKSFSNVIFEGQGGSWALPGPLTSTAAVTLNGGTLNLSGFVLSAFNFVSSNSNTRSIVFNGGSISLTGDANTSNQTLWDMTTATGFSITGNPVVNVPNASTNSGFTRTFNHGSISGATAATAISLNIQAGNTGSIISVGGSFLDLNFTGCSSTLNNTSKNIYGNLTLSASMNTSAGASVTTFASTQATARIITTNGKSFNCPIYFNGIGGSWQLQDAIDTAGYSITLNYGTFDSNNKNITCNQFFYNNGGVKTLILGTSTVSITGGDYVSGFVGISNNTTYSISNCKIVFTTAGSCCYSNGSGIIENGAGTVTMAGTGRLYLGTGVAEGSCGTLNNAPNRTCTFTIFCSTAFTVANFAVTGSETNSVSINSYNSTGYKTFKQTSGTVNAYYLVIQDILVTGGATWNAYNSINGTNNTGWNFLGDIKIVFKSSGTFTIPAGITSITAEAIGGGGGYGSGYTGGGGAYAKSSIIAVTPGNAVYVGVGPAALNSWVNTVNSAPVVGITPVTQAVLAAGGSAASGGQASASIGNIKYSGGNSGAVATAGVQRSSDPGAGGAAGPNGPGGNGGNGIASGASYLDTYGGGGGGGAGSGGAGNAGGAAGATSTTATQNGANGGNNAAGTGAIGIGGLGAGIDGSPGSNGAGGGGGGGDDNAFSGAGASGSVGVIRAWGIHGPGSGGGGNGGGVDGYAFGGASLYGGGGGSGSSGIVVISYSVSSGNSLALFF